MTSERTVTETAGKVVGETVMEQAHESGRHLRHQFRWLTKDRESEGYTKALANAHKTMDVVAAYPIDQIKSEVPWLLVPLPAPSKPTAPGADFEL